MKKSCETCLNYRDICCTKADGIKCNHDETWRSWEPINFWEPAKTTQPKQYEIVTPFSILDIYKKDPCREEFLRLLSEEGQGRVVSCNWKNFEQVKLTPTLIRNLDWLKKNGFVKEKTNLTHLWWVDTSYCLDMNLKEKKDYVFPQSGGVLVGWHTKVVLIEDGLKIPSRCQYEDHKYFDSIIQIPKTGDKFFTFSSFLKKIN